MSERPQTLIVGSAPSPEGERHYRSRIRAAGRVIAADGGLALCVAAGRTPDVCVGDFDSVDPALLERAAADGARIVRYPATKDESDLDLAADVAREEGGDLTITAAFFGRLDHTLASVGTLVRAADLLCVADEPAWVAYSMHPEHRAALTLFELAGTVLSLMAPAGPAIVSIDGVAYPLDRRSLGPLSSLGLSNVATRPEQRVRVLDGHVLVVVNRGLTLS